MSEPASCRAPGCLEHLLGLLPVAPLHLEAADLVHGLRLQAQVRADRDVVPGQVLDDLDLPFPAFQLDHHRSAFLHQAHGVVERLRGIGVTHERHVRHQERAPEPAGDRARVVDDVGDRHGHRRVVTLDDHAERIPYQHQVGAGQVDELREACVIGGETGDRFARRLHVPQRRHVDGRLRHAALFKLRIHDGVILSSGEHG